MIKKDYQEIISLYKKQQKEINNLKKIIHKLIRQKACSFSNNSPKSLNTHHILKNLSLLGRSSKQLQNFLPKLIF